jgi:hypothetical protein
MSESKLEGGDEGNKSRFMRRRNSKKKKEQEVSSSQISGAISVPQSLVLSILNNSRNHQPTMKMF